MSNHKARCLVKESTGALWYIYLENQILHYVRKTKKVWNPPEILDDFSFKYFVATITADNNVYVLAYTYSKKLWLYEWNGNKWNRRSIKSISSKYENITFISLKHVAGRLHMVFFIDNTLQKARVSLKHYVLEKGNFKEIDSLNFFSDDKVTPLKISTDNKGNLYTIYKRQFSKTTSFYLCIYKRRTVGWSKHHLLLRRSKLCKGFDGKFDKSGKLHMLWIEISHGSTELIYKKIEITDISINTSFEEIVLTTTNMDIEIFFLSISNSIGVFWMEKSTVFYTFIKHSIQNHSDIKVIKRKQVSSYTVVDNSNNYIDNTTMVLGDGYPNFNWSTLDFVKNITENKDKTTQLEYKNNVNLQDCHKALEKMEHKVEVLYNGLQHLHELIKEKDKSIYRHGTQIKQLSFELDQLRKRKVVDKPINEQKAYSNEIIAMQVSTVADDQSKNKKKVETETQQSNVKSVVDDNELSEDEDPIIDKEQEDASESLNDESLKEEIKDEFDGSDVKEEEITLGNVSIVINPEQELD